MSHPFTSTRSALAVTALGVVLAAAAPAYADPPSQLWDEYTFESTYQAGEFCDVAVHELVEGQFHETDFGDDQSISRDHVVFTYTNLETGASVTDTGRFTVWERDGALILTGLTVQLRGHGISAGRVVLDAETFEVISRSGHNVGDYGTAVCTALGAEPAA